MAVNTEKPHKPFYCHAYQCQVKGNLLKLMYGMKHGRLPSGPKLTGAEFREIQADLYTILTGQQPPERPSRPAASKPADKPAAKPEEPKRNVPLIRSENAKARELLEPFPIDQKLVREIEGMNPKASRYVRQRAF